MNLLFKHEREYLINCSKREIENIKVVDRVTENKRNCVIHAFRIAFILCEYSIQREQRMSYGACADGRIIRKLPKFSFDSARCRKNESR